MRLVFHKLPAIVATAASIHKQPFSNALHSTSVTLGMSRGGGDGGGDGDILSYPDHQHAIPPLVLIGDRELFTPCTAYDLADVTHDTDLRTRLATLRECQRQYGGIGIAACQVGWRTRIFCMGVEQDENDAARSRYPDAGSFPHQVLINPTLTPRQDRGTSWFWEGCLSVPGLRGWVERPNVVRVQGWNERGEPVEEELNGLAARVAQHEFDHLDGILFPDRALAGTLLPVQSFEEHGQDRWPEDWPTPGARHTKPGGFSEMK